MSRITVSALAALIAVFMGNFRDRPGSRTAASASVASADEQAVRQVTQNFVKAFNAGSAEKVAALFSGEAELIDDAGNVYKGNAAIKDAFGRFFEKFPGATSTMTADSVRMVGPGVGDRGGPAGGVDERRPVVRCHAIYVGDDQAARRVEDRVGTRGGRRRLALAARPTEAAGMAGGRLGR